MKILIFGGTTEGRKLSSFLAQKGVQVLLSVATEYGKSVIEKNDNLEISAKRLTCDEISAILENDSFDYVVDTTHPYANIVTQNIKVACDRTDTKYIRLVRNELSKKKDVICVESAEKAAEFLNKKEGNIFLTIGSKELEPFTKIENYAERCTVRILPMLDSLQKTLALGFANANVICMQGPLNVETNQVMFKATKAKYMVTKDSGDNSGFDSKVLAAMNLNCTVIVITRPTIEEGYSWRELLDFFHSLLI